MQAITLTEHELRLQLKQLEEEKVRKETEKKQQENYIKWKSRPEVFAVGRAYCEPEKESENFQIGISVPGNMGHTYRYGKRTTSAVVTYFHNVWDESLRRKMQGMLNDVVEQAVSMALSKPEVLLDLLGLQSDDHYLKRTNIYPKDKIKEIEDEINEERFKLIDQFKASDLLGISDKLSHSRSILYAYAKSRKLKRLTKEFQDKYDWAK